MEDATRNTANIDSPGPNHHPEEQNNPITLSHDARPNTTTSDNPLPEAETKITNTIPLQPHSIIHPIQCPRCSFPLRSPLRLPCGNTLCRSCLPPIRPRIGITYPVNEERLQGFDCDYSWGCGGEHCLGDCGVDVLMGKLGEVYRGVLGGGDCGYDDDDDDGRGGGGMEEKELIRVTWKRKGGVLGLDKEKEKERDFVVVRRGWLYEGVYGLIKEGRLEYGASEVSYDGSGDNYYDDDDDNNDHDDTVYTIRDNMIFDKLHENLRNELDCQVCYSLILDPLTTPCGHTFCRECLAGILHHSDLCPICRRNMNLPSTTIKSESVNKRISQLLELLYPDQTASRREETASTRVEFGLDNGKKIPLFVCALTFPTMPTFLHIFEPRYRLMIRRVMDSGEGEFGMLMYNRSRRRQGRLGRSEYMQYGTLLVIDRFELLPDGRSIVLATGVSRFRVVEGEILDGYHVGRVERVDDVSLAEEERVESVETAAATATTPPPDNNNTSNDDDNNNGAGGNRNINPSISADTPLESLSTQQLLQMGLNFVRRQRVEGLPWLQPRVLLAYGDMPTDPVKFPWWFASILRITEEEKYALLLATSVRERLKITAGWAQTLQFKEWPTTPIYKLPPL